MRNLYLKITCLAAAASGWMSCADTASLESQLTDLESRVEALEEQVTRINSNATAAYILHTGGLVVMDVHAYSDNTVYQLDMSDGSTVTIYIAEDGNGVTPTIGLDQDGNWTLQIWDDIEPQIIEGSQNAGGIIPTIGVDAEGYWQLSTDGGNTWEYIPDAENKIKATGESITDSFFESVDYNEENQTLDIIMASGESLSLNVHEEEIRMTVTDFDMEKGEPIYLNESKMFNATFTEDVADAYFASVPENWNARIEELEDGRHQFTVTAPGTAGAGTEYFSVVVYLESAEKHLRAYTFKFTLINEDYNSVYTEAWRNFQAGDPDNVLLDFSYAGYMHGEEAPAEITVTENADGTCTASNGYKVYNIEDYGADGTDEESDREAFLDAVSAALGTSYTENENGITFDPPKGDNADAIVYIPEGNFIFHTEDDNVPDASYAEDAYSRTIIIRASNFILKGAGREKSKIVMKSPLLPSGSNGKDGVDNSRLLYASPDMIQIKNNTGVQYNSSLADVTGDSPKGSFKVSVGNTAGLTPGQWVCLYMAPNPDAQVVADELAPHSPDGPAAGRWVISSPGDGNGVTVEDFHQIRSVSGNTVTFYEPLMHEVKADYGWSILSYKYYQNNGIEDLTFVGDAKEDFVHHASWEDDGGYKPISMSRMVNSWMRRVDFESVSEACSIISSANVSVYDCRISGKRGHSSIRSQGSSRVFIGKVTDTAHGKLAGPNGQSEGTGNADNTGQYHATGVSKLSMGAVLWNNVWGDDSCFESHASQPRATLIDICKGGFMRFRQGGDETQVPNHLNDLTLWNFEATNVSNIALDLGAGAKFVWWDAESRWWKILPPVIVGFHGEQVTFDESPEQVKLIESNGTAVQPESLYEAQLKNRLGYVPAWLQALK